MSERRQENWWKMATITGLCFVATVVNPYHVRLYAVIFEYATQTVPYLYINEFGPLPFRSLPNWAFLGLFCTAVFSLGRRRKASSFEVLLLIATAYFSFRVQRDVWFATIAAVGVIVSGARTVRAADIFRMTKFRLGMVAGTLGLCCLALVQYLQLSTATLEAAVASRYPVAAAAFVEAQGYRGPLYNSYGWGGYLLWRLPHLPVILDGRTDVHGDERNIRSFLTWSGEGMWTVNPDLTTAGLVISHQGQTLTSLLRLDPHFELAYEDQIAAVFVATPLLAGDLATRTEIRGPIGKAW
jgi:hypothetical protein